MDIESGETKARSSRFRLGGLQTRFIALLGLALLPAFAFMVFNASKSRSMAIDEAQADAMRLTELAVSNQRQYIDSARDILITLAQVPAIQSQDRPACLFFLSNVLMQHPLYANFGAADAYGEVFCMTLPQRMPINIADEMYFQQSMENRDFSISEYQISAINSQAVITLSYPVSDPLGQPQGIVFANLDLRWLGQFMAATSLPEGSTLRVVDRNGIILASYPDGEIEIGQRIPEQNVLEIVLQQGEGLIRSRDSEDVNRFFSFKSLPAGGESDLYMIIGIPTASAYGESNQNLKQNMTALSLGALLALVIAYLGTQWFFLRQVKDLVGVTKRLSDGDLSVRTACTSNRNELDLLSHAFDEMAEALQQRDEDQLWAQEQVRRQTHRAESLARIAGHLNAELDLESVLQSICDEASLALNAPATAVVVYQPGREDLYHIGGQVVSKEQHEGFTRLGCMTTDEAENRLDPDIVKIDLQAHPETPLAVLADSMDVRFLVCDQLIHEGVVIGRLELYIREDQALDDDVLILLHGIADEAALAITNARLYTALRKEERARAELLHQVIGAQEDERRRIARELHDETSQSLTALLVGLDTIRIASKNEPTHVTEHVQDLKTITNNLLLNIHRLIADLRPSLLDDLGLLAAIEWFGEQRLRTRGIGFQIESNIREKRLDLPLETALFRIAQEGLTNILRHAKAENIYIRLWEGASEVVLEITDDGQGFNPACMDTPDPVGRGLGLLGMRERAVILGGSLDIQSASDQGTIIRAAFPQHL
ncbi:MAG: HAMP domain-containing protein [Anaerolineales bacterium]|nr:HAMP domain-containing protein [Anaerolineales bacterium]